jgi:quinol-cytochrome oxidoreductase complex cytochrome b subunit
MEMILSIIGWIIGAMGIVLGLLGLLDKIENPNKCRIIMWACIALMWAFCLIDTLV